MTSVNITKARKAHILMYRKFSHQNAIKEKKKMVLMVNVLQWTWNWISDNWCKKQPLFPLWGNKRGGVLEKLLIFYY